MSGVDELLAFVRRCLDDDERMARAADSGRWLPEDKGITFEYRADDFHGGEAQARLVADTRANQWHIANWDPQRVLAEVKAKRAILDARDEADQDAKRNRNEPGFLAGADAYDNAVRELAQPYAGQDGWREEWRT